MKILQINTVYNYGSTGRIAADIAMLANQHGDECVVAYGYGAPSNAHTFRMQNKLGRYYSVFVNRIFGKHGFYNRHSTKKLIRFIKHFEPDVVHLHNIHGYYLNIKMLFTYLKKIDKPVVWTFHDCWSFTGHCTHFDVVGCDKWKTDCHDCPQYRIYPKSLFFDRSRSGYRDKKKLFTSLSDLTIVTPSNWLAGLVKHSFFKEYPVKVIYNGADLSVFKPTPSDLKQQLGIADKKVILGIAKTLEDGKGGRYMVDLAKALGEDYVVLILTLQTNEKLPKNVIALPRTDSKAELAKLYSIADVFINPTMQEVLGMVNIEAMACGTPVVTFETGGSPESLGDTGYVAKKGDLEDLLRGVLKMMDCPPDQNVLVEQASHFDGNDKFMEYLTLYHEVGKQNE